MNTPTATNHTGAIVGGVIGGLAGLAIILAAILFLFRRRIRRDSRKAQGRFQSAGPIDKIAPLAGERYGELYQPPAEIGPSSEERAGMAELPGRSSGEIKVSYVYES